MGSHLNPSKHITSFQIKCLFKHSTEQEIAYRIKLQMTVRRKTFKRFMSSSDVMNQNHYKEETYLTINYKRLKKKQKWMVNPDMLFVYILMLSFDPVFSQHQVQTCAPATQQSIFNSLPQCESRTTLV